MTKLLAVELLEFNVRTENSKRIYVITAGLLASLEAINQVGGVGVELDTPALGLLSAEEAIARTGRIDPQRVCGWLTNLRIIKPTACDDPTDTLDRSVLVADFETTGVFGRQLDEHLRAGRELFFAARTLCWVDDKDQRYYLNQLVTADAQPIPPLPRE